MTETKKYRNRNVELREVEASSIILSERNYRKHPPEQEAAMQALLDEVGWAGALVARETSKGIELIDGEMRQGMDGIVPVIIIDVDDHEADLLLSLMNPIGAMAQTGREAYDALVNDAKPSADALIAVQAAVADGYMTALQLPVERTERRRRQGPTSSGPEPRVATCSCGTKVSAFIDSMLKHAASDHPEPVTEFLKTLFEGVPS